MGIFPWHVSGIKRVKDHLATRNLMLNPDSVMSDIRNTSETDYDVIKYNHMSAQTGILNSLVTRVFCPVQTTPT